MRTPRERASLKMARWLLFRHMAAEMEAALEQVRQEEREACAMLHESLSPDCDHDLGKVGPTSGPGGMGLLIRYRDAIRARGQHGE